MVDYHVHPDFSPDARGSVAECCRVAVARGLDEVCFTTHWEPDPARRDREWVNVAGRRVAMDGDWPAAYLSTIEACRHAFPGLGVRAGLEVGYEPAYEPEVRRFLAANQFDFVLGAVHCLDSTAITAGSELDELRRVWVPGGAGRFVARYFEVLRAAARSGLFDSLAHIDAYRKYARPLFDDSFDDAVARELPATLGVIAGSGTGIEVNSSARRRGQSEAYPGTAILRLAVEAGVRVFTTGSDAHSPADVGFGIEDAAAVLGGLALSPCRFCRRQRV